MTAALRLVPDVGRAYPRATTSPEVERWITVQTAEGKAKRTIQDRRTTMARFERDTGTSAIEATDVQVTAWLARDPDRRVAISIASDLSKLRAFYRWALLAGMRGDDPTAHIKAPRRPRSQPRPVTPEQFWRLIDQAHNRDLRAMLLLAGLAGLRVHEVAKFHGRDLDTEAATITVVGKGGHLAVLPAHPLIVEQAKVMPLSYWFPSQRGRHLERRTVWQRIRLHMIRCRVPGTPHCLRHFFGTELVSQGSDLRVVQELMRHSQLSTTAVYVGVADGRKRAAIETLRPRT